MSDYTDVLSRVEARRIGDGRWLGKCPAHADDRNSLALTLKDNGRLLIHCHAGCDFKAVVKEIGLPMECYGLEPKTRDSDKPQIEASYRYEDEEGQLLYEVLRYRPKDFRVRRPAPDGGWIWNLDATPRVPYRLPEILEKCDWPVIICEGEKDVEALRKLGLLATTCSGGAGKWPIGNTYLRGRRVVIIPDNDLAGINHACDVAGKLIWGKCQSMRIVVLPGLAEKGDVSDWLASGGTKQQLLELIRATPEYKLDGETPAVLRRAA